MTRRADGLRRRDLLVGAAAVGGLGALTGLGTGALLVDREEVAAFFRGGELDLAVAWTDAGGASTSGGGVSLDVGPLSAGDAGHAVVTVDLPQGPDPNNPAYLWLRTLCPTSSNGLARDLTVSLWYADAGGSRLADGLVFEGPLCEVASDFRNGVVLDGDPTTPGRDCLDTTGGGDPLALRFEWSLAADYEGTESTTVGFEVTGTQCRHDPGTEVPFDPVGECVCAPPEDDPERRGVSYVEIYGCDPAVTDRCDCVKLGKLELDDYPKCDPQAGIGDNHVVPGTYDLLADGDCEDGQPVDTGYDLRVTSTTEKAGPETTGVGFELLADDGSAGPDLCKAVVKGGRATVVYGPEAFDGNATDGELDAPLA